MKPKAYGRRLNSPGTSAGGHSLAEEAAGSLPDELSVCATPQRD
nr:MAG TPA: hypothetical protein [Caudoviricetes sp.]